ncbi:hypothetical protein [Streptomyces sp. NBC_01589]|uniref:hypothetical protein n=1 Tax=unclassified Streptomyces TaxID=2593676 RepID=UPI0038698B11
MSALDRFLVGYDSRKVQQQVQVHERIAGFDVEETVTVKPLRVFEKRPDGSLVELHGAAKDHALDAFWAASDLFNQQENDR